MILLFLGISGSGKDTQAQQLADKFGFEVVSTGELLRQEIEEGTEVGKMIEKKYFEGKWIDDVVVYNLLAKKLGGSKDGKFILTGAVRNGDQPKMLDNALNRAGYQLDKVVLFELDEKDAEERLLSRARKDDEPNAIKQRFAEFDRTIAPIIEEYEGRGILLRIDASPSIEQIHQELLDKLGWKNN